MCCVRRIHDGGGHGATVRTSAQGRLERCELCGNAAGGVILQSKSDPTLVACIIRDNGGPGLTVAADASGWGTVRDCTFARNAGKELTHHQVRMFGGNRVHDGRF